MFLFCVFMKILNIKAHKHECFHVNSHLVPIFTPLPNYIIMVKGLMRIISACSVAHTGPAGNSAWS